jgi:hypothetical protein
MDQRPEESLSLAIEYVTGTKSGRNDGISLDQFVEIVGSELTLPKGEESQRFRDVLGMLKDFAAREVVKRPLSIAVFGPPGSGKSRGVKLLLKEIGGCRPAVEINLSQVDNGGILTETMAREIQEANREYRERRKKAKKQGVAENSPGWPQRNTIVYIFDEFDSSRGTEPLGWLRWFLSPMQDGQILHNGEPLPIGKCVFVFTGGTAERFAEFETRARQDETTFRERKVPDFISRLRGFIDIGGLNMDGGERNVRRALALKHMLKERSPTASIDDPELLKSFLDTTHFTHGMRSLEALLDMSRLTGAKAFTKDLLPNESLLRLHISLGPLDGKTIGVSAGINDAQRAKELFRRLSRSLLLRGATIAYGGELLLSEGTLGAFVAAAQSLATRLVGSDRRMIRNYLAFPAFHNPDIPKPGAETDRHVEFHKLATLSPDEAEEFKVPLDSYFVAQRRPGKNDPEYSPLRHLAWSISLFRMRLRMIEEIDVLIVLGGGDGNNWGRFSGIAEEVVIAVALGKPVYILGGVGGAAHAVGSLMGLGPSLSSLDACLTETSTAVFQSLLSQHSDRFSIPGNAALPQTIKEVREYLFQHGVTTSHWRWNGLDIVENRSLFACGMDTDGPKKCVDFITRGLSRLHWHPPAESRAALEHHKRIR